MHSSSHWWRRKTTTTCCGASSKHKATTTRQQAEIIFKGLPQTNFKPKTVYDNYKVPFKSFRDCFLISCKHEQRSYVRGNDFLNLKKELQEVVDKFNESKKENLVHISPRVSNWKLVTQNKGNK